MSLEEFLRQKIDSLGLVRWKKSFGWISATTVPESKFFGGYQVIDENDLKLLLRLSPEDFKEAIGTGYFEKFEFGKTWVETEITGEEEFEQSWPFIEKAYNFVKSEERK